MEKLMSYMINYVLEDSNELTIKGRLLKILFSILISLIVAGVCFILFLYVSIGVFVIDFISYIITGKAIIWNKLRGKIS